MGCRNRRVETPVPSVGPQRGYWCEARLSPAEVLAAHQSRLRLAAFGRLSNRYLDELERLLSDPNPVIRSCALEHFRKTVGLETASAVNVNVNQRTTVSNDQPCSFEEIMVRVRVKLLAERNAAEAGNREE